MGTTPIDGTKYNRSDDVWSTLYTESVYVVKKERKDKITHTIIWI